MLLSSSIDVPLPLVSFSTAFWGSVSSSLEPRSLLLELSESFRICDFGRAAPAPAPDLVISCFLASKRLCLVSSSSLLVSSSESRNSRDLNLVGSRGPSSSPLPPPPPLPLGPLPAPLPALRPVGRAIRRPQNLRVSSLEL